MHTFTPTPEQQFALLVWVCLLATSFGFGFGYAAMKKWHRLAMLAWAVGLVAVSYHFLNFGNVAGLGMVTQISFRILLVFGYVLVPMIFWNTGFQYWKHAKPEFKTKPEQE